VNKNCCRCQKSKPVSEFNKNSKKKDGFNSACRPCQSAYTKAHYQATKDQYIARVGKNNAAYKAAVMERIKELKSVPCADCHKSYPHYVMDFDHQGDKKFEVSDAVFSKGWSASKAKVELIFEEIKKCEVVCANCHRERTHGLSSGSGTEAPNLG
jgi:hypothetical protein